VAQAIGARAQSGKTYLEKHHAEFDGLGVDDLIKHALKALSGTTGALVRLSVGRSVCEGQRASTCVYIA